MHSKVIRQATVAVVVGWAISATVAARAGTLGDQIDWRLIEKYFESGTDADDGLADRFFSITGNNLAIKFTLADGATLDNIEIAINDSSGERVVDIRSDDALILFKLPEGDYTVESTWRGETVKRAVTLSTIAQSTLAINWNQEDAAPN